MTPGAILLLLFVLAPFAWWFITAGDDELNPLNPYHAEILKQRRVDQEAAGE